MTPLLVVDNISRSIGGTTILNCVGFELLEHEIVAVIGTNGSGKTSILNLISRFNEPDQGTISFKGQSTLTLAPHERFYPATGRRR